jgi:hypothetical protein
MKNLQVSRMKQTKHVARLEETRIQCDILAQISMEVKTSEAGI